MVNNTNEFKLNSDVLHLNARQNNLHQPSSNLLLYEKRVCWSGMKLFNNLLQSNKTLSNKLNNLNQPQIIIYMLTLSTP
jgi:hypothetical protein